MNTLFASLNGNFSRFSWFERIQKMIITLALSSSQQQGFNVWDELLIELEKSTRETEISRNAASSVEHQFKLRFSAHMAILLMLHNRVGQVDTYNIILNRYIIQINESSNLHAPTKLTLLPFYISMVLGEQAQKESYARILIGERDDSFMKSIRSKNTKYFSAEMCKRILYSVPDVNMYNGMKREEFLEKNWHLVRNNIKF